MHVRRQAYVDHVELWIRQQIIELVVTTQRGDIDLLGRGSEIPLDAGPVEATAIGNLMIQLVAAGSVASISQAREVVRTSFEVEQYMPSDPDVWHEAADRFAGLIARES